MAEKSACVYIHTACSIVFACCIPFRMRISLDTSIASSCRHSA